ncbi:CaiB/BaiF CoA transferase family protein [Chloroflexota bacterium]
MNYHQDIDTHLGPYRILDLTEGGCMVGGRFLGDMGADIIKIEPPGGSISRIAPFYKDIPHPEKSLFWFAYNTNKRSITLDIGRLDGQEIFRRLAKTADAVIESYEPGFMKQLRLGYTDLCKIKPDIIVTSITPFGQTGPKAHYKASDLTAWASGGYLSICGDADRSPVWIGFPQASLHAGAEAAPGTLAAISYRNMTGEGQHVDVSMQECVIACDFQTPELWDLNKVEISRLSHYLQTNAGGVRQRQVWKCRDGCVVLIPTGSSEPFISAMKNLVQWMGEEGMAKDWLKEIDWAEGYDSSIISQDLVDKVEEAIGNFLLTRSKTELYEEGALNRRILIAPIANTKDVCENIQLYSRDFWMPVEHEELGDTLTYPGPPLKLCNSPISYRRRAPRIGEHNSEVYLEELGFTTEDLMILKQASII